MAQNPPKSDGKFPLRLRLRKREEYGAVFARPTRVQVSGFTLLLSPNDKTFARLGLSISKRVARLASQRNRLKRVIRESFRLQNDLPAVNIVVQATPRAQEMTNHRLDEALNEAWERIRNLRCDV